MTKAIWDRGYCAQPEELEGDWEWACLESRQIKAEVSKSTDEGALYKPCRAMFCTYAFCRVFLSPDLFTNCCTHLTVFRNVAISSFLLLGRSGRCWLRYSEHRSWEWNLLLTTWECVFPWCFPCCTPSAALPLVTEPAASRRCEGIAFAIEAMLYALFVLFYSVKSLVSKAGSGFCRWWNQCHVKNGGRRSATYPVITWPRGYQFLGWLEEFEGFG